MWALAISISPRLRPSQQSCDAAGGQAVAWHYDQADEATINALVESAVAHFGRLDGLFANVADLQAVLVDGDILSNDSALWERTLRVNVTGTALLLRAVLPHMLQQGSGALVLTSSDAAVVGEPERPAYAASKAGVNALCRHVATQMGSAGHSLQCGVARLCADRADGCEHDPGDEGLGAQGFAQPAPRRATGYCRRGGLPAVR